MSQPPVEILLAAPRGTCAGVARAIQIVEQALRRYGAPVYVRHEIVHNRFVVEELESRGAVFVEELDDVPPDSTVIFSAHGVPKAVTRDAQGRQLHYIDATCPLVSKVHREAERHHADGQHILLIGHAGHPEVIGTMGQLPEGGITLIESIADAEAFAATDPDQLAYATQTTLSVDETADIVAVLQRRFPNVAAPKKEDICYATTNRQTAVKAMAGECDAFLVIGAHYSSNSVRLVEVAKRSGCVSAMLVQRATDIDFDALAGARTIGVSAGASAPEVLVQEVIEAFRARMPVTVREVRVANEGVEFKLPRELAAAG